MVMAAATAVIRERVRGPRRAKGESKKRGDPGYVPNSKIESDAHPTDEIDLFFAPKRLKAETEQWPVVPKALEPRGGCAIFDSASREGLTPSPTCHTGQGGSRKGMWPLRQRNGSHERQPSSAQTDGGFFNV